MASIMDTPATQRETRAVAVPDSKPRNAVAILPWSRGTRCLFLSAILFLFPFYLIVRNALMTQPEITAFEWKWWAEIGAMEQFRSAVR